MQVAEDTFSNVKRSTWALQKKISQMSALQQGAVMEMNLYTALPHSSIEGFF